MNRNELIQRIDSKLFDFGVVVFNHPVQIKSQQNNIKEISFSTIKWSNYGTDADLSDLTNDELSNLFCEIERQIETNQKLFEQCSDFWY